MRILVERFRFTPNSTTGRLYIDGKPTCFTLEDVVREVPGKPVDSWKVNGKTAIPYGEYKVSMSFSGRFQKMLPILFDVPGFAGVRIHAGNTSADTEGCILLGLGLAEDSVVQSRAAMAAVQPLIEQAVAKKEPITLKIVKAV